MHVFWEAEGCRRENEEEVAWFVRLLEQEVVHRVKLGVKHVCKEFDISGRGELPTCRFGEK